MTQTITLTADQAAAFQRGESITLLPPTPPKLLTYIVVGQNGSVYEAKTTEALPARFTRYRGEGTLTRLRRGVLPPHGPLQRVGQSVERISLAARPGGHFDAIQVQG